MIEKVNPCHPDKVADRIAGAIVDLAYTKEENPKMAVEVLIGHEKCTIITESSVGFDFILLDNPTIFNALRTLALISFVLIPKVRITYATFSYTLWF